MAGLDDIIKLLQQSQILSKQIRLASQLSQLAKTQELWKQNRSGLNMFAEIAKSFSQQAIINRSHFAGFDTIAKAIALQPKFNIPITAFDAINSISQKHEQLFGNLRSITDIFKHNQAFSQLSSLQFALGDISGQLAATALINKRWNLLDDFEEISNEAVVINEKIIDDEGITTESLAEIKSFLERIEIRVDKIDADASLIFWKIITILSFILGVASEIRNWIPKPNYATKEDVEVTIKKQFSTFESKLKMQNEYRTTNRVCKVMLKPKNKTLILITLSIGFDVIVLQVNHKWIYVSFISPKDNLPQTGWVMKKYLSKPK